MFRFLYYLWIPASLLYQRCTLSMSNYRGAIFVSTPCAVSWSFSIFWHWYMRMFIDLGAKIFRLREIEGVFFALVSLWCTGRKVEAHFAFCPILMPEWLSGFKWCLEYVVNMLNILVLKVPTLYLKTSKFHLMREVKASHLQLVFRWSHLQLRWKCRRPRFPGTWQYLAWD